ncbi:LuxR family transcriptional regulator [Streptomyces spiroverticillatus]|nr:LuxR C-terminal-related transcriptional regulator [Streptomyces finlayi]GHA40567.1 LuxR family transcriptional regulator [Streptomyces spiroverticillatus]
MADTVWHWQRGDLPEEMTSFVGREREIDAVRTLFRTARMVTLLGPGGVGKTRIAVRAAASLAGHFRGGVRMVELAGVKDGELVPYTVGAAFGLPEGTGRNPLDMVVEYLRGEETLLVLDTCEHLVDACAMFAEILLRNCPGLRLLLTSRQALDVPAEHAVTVAPLEFPGERSARDAETCDAVRLFLDRAVAARPGFQLTDDNRDQVVALCRRLDGIPLAMELAAVRLRALPLEQVLRRLEDRFRALGASRSGHPRHQTLRTAIDWSHDLCTPEERTLWARLSVFAGGFDLAAAERVCADADLDPYDLVDHLIGLVDKSVVVREEGEDGDRYRMLDTVREYGAERLAETGGGARRLVVRHRDHYLRLAREADAEWFGPDQVAWTRRLDREVDNFRTALEFCFEEPGEAAAGVAIAGALGGLWIGRTRLAEGYRWCVRALATGAGTEQDQARTQWLGAFCVGITGRMDLGEPLMALAVETARRAGDPRTEGVALACLGAGLEHLQRLDEAEVASRSALVLAEAAEGTLVECWVRRNLGSLYGRRGEVGHALSELEHALALAPPGECWVTSYTLSIMAQTNFDAGDCRTAGEFARKAVRTSMRLGDLYGASAALLQLSWCAHREGDRMLGVLVDAGTHGAVGEICSILMGNAHLEGIRDRLTQEAKEALGEVEFDRLRAEGATLGLRQVVALALDEPPHDSRLPAPPTLDALTRREREVAALVHQGLSNREIAERLVISKRTADAHVEHILAKLGFGSRGEIAALVGAENSRERTRSS